MCPQKSTMVDGMVCGVHTCGVPTHGMKEQLLGPVCLGTVWVSTVEWVWPSRADCQSMTLCIKLCTFLMHLQCISEALPCTLMHCISDSTCYTTPHHPLHPCLCTCHLCLFVCLFTFVTGACCRWENGSVYRPPTKLDFEVQNILAQNIPA